jgi:sodium-dependent dicarboxylate transporter 2/3/5
MHAKEKIRPRRIFLAFLFAMIFFFLEFPITEQAHIVLVITAFTGFLWFTEAMPLHITALLSTMLLIVFGGFSAKSAFSPYFAPTIVLFFGGFMIARAMQKHKLDHRVAHRFTSKFGSDPRFFILGLMLITALLSFLISNTASAAIMLPIALIAVTHAKLKPLKSKFAKAAVLGIAFSATIGGIGTIVGSPPNAITVADLAHEGIEVTFLEWMYYGVPFVIVFLPIAWLILTHIYKPEIKKIKIEKDHGKYTKKQLLIIAVGALTMITWVTSFMHGISDSVVSVGAVVLLFALSLLKTEDISKIQWPALLLFGGGLSLGVAIDASGLGSYLGAIFGSLITGQSLFLLFLSVIVFAVILTLSASNTATAALLIPIIIPLAKTLGVGIKPLAIIAGMGTSLDFLVPVGTPPSAIAYSSGCITVWDMIRAGAFITVAGIILLAFMAWLYW